jgi:hypothetical protein
VPFFDWHFAPFQVDHLIFTQISKPSIAIAASKGSTSFSPDFGFTNIGTRSGQ